MHLSLPEQLPLLYFGFLCLPVSSVSNFCPDTRRLGGHLFRFSCVVGREGHCKQILLTCVGSAHSVWITLGLSQLKAVCASRVYTAQAPGCSAVVLSKAGTAFHALPRSKPLSFSGTPQGHILSCLCILCPAQVQAAQGTRCLVSTLSQVGRES